MPILSTILLAGAASVATSTQADDDARPFDILLDMRARYQSVEQAGKLDANSSTLRTRLGVDIPLNNSAFSLLAELENNVTLTGDDERNTSLKPKGDYATINDPDFTELNRFQLTWNPEGPFSAVAGRQYLGFDGGRFIGSPGWGQDKNSHDAVRLNYSEGVFAASYVFHWRVNRGPGDEFDWETDSHLFHATLTPSENFQVAGFAYVIDISEPGRDNLSNATWGARTSGSTPFSGFDVSYDVIWATQTDNGSATADFRNTLFNGEIGLARAGARVALGYDVLEGDGSTSIVNPLASNHGFAGWADVFAGGGRAAPADGLEDFHIHARYGQSANHSFLQGWSVDLIWRDYEAQNTGVDLGTEWDGRFSLSLTDAVGLGVKYADYESSGAPTAPGDRRKTWVYLTYMR